MEELKRIVEKYKDNYPEICDEIEIFIAKKEILTFLEFDDYTRIFPINGSHYIDIYWDDDHDERIYVAFSIFYNKGLSNYIEKMQEHEAVLKICVRKNLYLKDQVFEDFKKILGKECINVCTDIWNYEFVDEL